MASTTACAECDCTSPVSRSRTTIAARGAVVDDDVEHLRARVQLDLARRDLAHHRLVGAEQQLLAGLPARVERARDLRAAERAVVEQPAVLARERHALRRRLVDDLVRDLREPVDVGLARAEVAALDRVVEEPEDRVAVVAVVLGGVDPALRGDRVRPPRRVVEREDRDLVAELGERRGGARAREPGADDDDLEAPLVGRVDEPHGEAMVVPRAAGSRPAGPSTRAPAAQFDHPEHDGERERDVAGHDQRRRRRSRTGAATAAPSPCSGTGSRRRGRGARRARGSRSRRPARPARARSSRRRCGTGRR